MRTSTRTRLHFVLAALSVCVPSPLLSQTELVPGTAVLLNQSTSSGNGGNTSSTTSSTNIFSPASYSDYKRSGGEPTVVVDRYAFKPGQFGNTGATDQFRDLDYSCAPVGVGYPGASFFWRSTNIGQTWRLPPHDPIIGFFPTESGGGGGDCHIVIGQLTHKVFFVDLPVGCGTMNISSDLGQTFTSDRGFRGGN